MTATFEIEGFRIRECRGLVREIVVRSPTIPQGIVGSLKDIIGGRIGAYANMCEQTRDQAYREMVKHAEKLDANAIVGIRMELRERLRAWRSDRDDG